MDLLLRLEWPALIVLIVVLWLLLPPKIAAVRQYLASRQHQSPPRS